MLALRRCIGCLCQAQPIAVRGTIRFGTIMDETAAETIALQALTFLVSDEGSLRGFLAQTGATVQDLKNGAGNPQFLAGVVEFLLEQDERLLAFCEHANLTPEQLQRARYTLPGASPSL